MLLVSGATGVEGINEAHAMRQFLIEAGIPDDRILVDDKGANTLLTARNVRKIMSEERLSSALIVSHYFHLARCKLLFEEQGIHCVTVPARMSRRLIFESYFVMRECAGYLWYVLTRPLRSASASSVAQAARRCGDSMKSQASRLCYGWTAACIRTRRHSMTGRICS
jgi:hypothetical protein